MSEPLHALAPERVRVKICGTTTLADALLAIEAGAEDIGFVLAPSKRRVTPEQVREITDRLPDGTETVGVFTSTDAADILAAIAASGLSAVQLHGDYLPALVAALRAGPALRTGKPFRISQVIAVPVAQSNTGDAAFEETLRALAANGGPDVLLDSSVGGAAGGTGVAFEWQRMAAVVDRVWPRGGPQKLGVAGGLRPETVAEAIAVLRPDFVDVVSGVESAPGVKDPRKLRAFMRSARFSGPKSAL